MIKTLEMVENTCAYQQKAPRSDFCTGGNDVTFLSYCLKLLKVDMLDSLGKNHHQTAVRSHREQ